MRFRRCADRFFFLVACSRTAGAGSCGGRTTEDGPPFDPGFERFKKKKFGGKYLDEGQSFYRRVGIYYPP